jgi:hypothetical protein
MPKRQTPDRDALIRALENAVTLQSEAMGDLCLPSSLRLKLWVAINSLYLLLHEAGRIPGSDTILPK